MALTQKVDTELAVDGSALATAAGQTTTNTNTGNAATGIGAVADAVVAAGAEGSVNAKLRRVTTDLAAMSAKLPAALGQQLEAASVAVVLPAAQLTTLTPPAAITGFATSAKQDTLNTELTTGASIFRSIDLDESEEDVKTSAGRLLGGVVMNMAATVRYLKFYNATAANTTVGTTTPVMSIPIPTLATTNGAGFVLPIAGCGIAFDTAICVAATTGLADNDTGAPGASEVVVNLFYK